MEAVVAQVDQIVQQVHAGGAERERHKGERRLAERGQLEDVAGQQSDEDQRVLGILVDAQQLRPSAPGRAVMRQVFRVGRDNGKLARNAARCADGDGIGCARPDRKVGSVVADIVEAAQAEMGTSRFALDAPARLFSWSEANQPVNRPTWSATASTSRRLLADAM
jgi:hypothetical protein